MRTSCKVIIGILVVINVLFLGIVFKNTGDSITDRELNKAFLATVEITVTSLDYESYHGTGFVIDSEGLIITNKHVVVNEQTSEAYNGIFVFFPSTDMNYSATLVYQSEMDDIAILDIDCDEEFKKLDLATSNEVHLGDLIYCIGNVQGTGLAVYFGNIASNIRLVEYDDKQVEAIQMDLEIYPGMSGGPIINAEGKVVGIATFRIIEQGSTPAEGMNFALSFETIQNNLDEYLSIE